MSTALVFGFAQLDYELFRKVFNKNGRAEFSDFRSAFETFFKQQYNMRIAAPFLWATPSFHDPRKVPDEVVIFNRIPSGGYIPDDAYPSMLQFCIPDFVKQLRQTKQEIQSNMATAIRVKPDLEGKISELGILSSRSRKSSPFTMRAILL